MENNPQNFATENQNSVGTPAEATKITFINRYFHLSAPHNRVSRSTFLVNIIILEVLLNFLPSSIFVTLGFLFFYLVQITKRFHDFGKSGRWAAGVIVYRLLLIFGPYIYFLATGENSFAGAFAYAFFMLEYGLYLSLAAIIPDIILALIPGDKNENQYGKPQVL